MNEIITNGTEIKNRIISEISNAKHSIFLAMAFFTDRDIANEIISAKERGILIDIILSSNAQNETVKLMFAEKNIKLHSFETGDPRGMMHHKFCLIDGKITINGSYNYSYNASNNNVENIHVSDDINIYKQLYAEFEKLRYKIDHQIDVNSNNDKIMESPTRTRFEHLNVAESFTQHLSNLIYTTANIDTEIYKNQGYENSKESAGNIEIFKSNYSEIKEKIKQYATDDNLGSKKNIIIQQIKAALENKESEINSDREAEISKIKSVNEIEIRQIKTTIEDFKSEKFKLESGNEESGEDGLLQVNLNIQKTENDIVDLEGSFIVKKFLKAETVFAILGLLVFTFYLIVFFSSAMYKVFFEANEITNMMEAGHKPNLPKVVDANSIIVIFKDHGTLFGLMAAFFFMVPLLLSNLKLINKSKKWINIAGFIVGIVVFDVIVAYMVAKNTNDINNTLNGINEEIGIIEVLSTAEFWLIFVFGMFPLFITHFLIDYLAEAYKKSQPDIVDSEKNRQLQVLNNNLYKLKKSKEYLINKIQHIQENIDEKKETLNVLEMNLNSEINEIKAKFQDILKSIKDIYDDFISKIHTGRIFTEEIFRSVSIAYKTGFIEYLPELYAEKEVSNRVFSIETVIAKQS